MLTKPPSRESLSADRSLAALLSESGVHTAFLTDEPCLARYPSAAGFADVLQLDLPEPEETADDVDQTYLAKCFAQLIGQVESRREPFLFWCHWRALGAAWDAPLEFRGQYVEPGDPEPPATAEVPQRLLEEEFDPDEVLGISQAYAGQVSLLDTCVAALRESLEASARQTLLILASARGFPLGEHRRIGPCDDALYSELVQVPLILRFPGQRHAAGRSQALVEPADLWATILDWHGLPPAGGPLSGKSLLPIARDEVQAVRDRLCVTGPEQRAIRTPAWYLRELQAEELSGSDLPEPDQGVKVELFAKPDDRWEVNEVSDRAAEVVALLRNVMRDYEDAAQDLQSRELATLDEILISGTD